MNLRTEVLSATRVLDTDATTANGAITIPDDLTSNPIAADPSGLWTPPSVDGHVPNSGMLIPIGTAAQDDTGRVWAFGLLHVGSNRWTHVPAWVIDYTTGSLATGETNEFYADTISGVTSNYVDGVDSSGASEFANSVAYFRWDLLGFAHWRFLFELGSSNALTSMNAFVKGY